MKSTVYAHLENDYRFYRLPLFRATAVKYGWNNPIGKPTRLMKKQKSLSGKDTICLSMLTQKKINLY